MPYPIVTCQVGDCHAPGLNYYRGVYRCKVHHRELTALTAEAGGGAAMAEAEAFYGGPAVREHHASDDE